MKILVKQQEIITRLTLQIERLKLSRDLDFLVQALMAGAGHTSQPPSLILSPHI